MKKSDIPTPRYPLTIYDASCPMAQVHLDFLRPPPESKSGNEYILMTMDQLNKWVECIPIPFQIAKITAAIVVSESFCMFGYPLHQGRNFESSLLKSLRTALLIKKYWPTPYYPSSNGQVER
ncbi:Pol polyprotein [Plakobranchus ocellatus]|uniref:Pol polyprotein n=1 Tax=Plakobranchus ocellatus TaxID=259542 RepID=A0AAV4D4H0_9GAST|nr:Pol polyprotein [Plakobranchus ocellatus]